MGRNVSRVLALGFALVVGLGVWFRVSSLESIPEVNGDEAFFGVQAHHILEGEPVRLFTTNHMPLTPFHTGVEVVLLRTVGYKLWILRAPALAAGLAAVLLTYVLAARLFDRDVARVAVAALAALPCAILYSRLGYEQSVTPLLSLLLLAAAYSGRWTWVVLLTLAAYLAHPTNLFLAPVVVLATLARAWMNRAERPGRARVEMARTAAYCGLVVVLGLNIMLRPKTQQLSAAFDCGLGGKHEPLRFLELAGRTLIGTGIYGVPLDRRVDAGAAWDLDRRHDVAFWAVAALALALGLPGLIRARRWDRLALPAGLALGAFALFVVGGSEILQPDMNRYGMFMVTPAVLSFAVLAGSWLESAPGPRRLAARRATLLALGCALLATVHQHFFSPYEATARESIWTYGSEAPDHHREALKSIVRDRGAPPAPGAAPTRVVTLDFWSEQPLAYLAEPRRDLEVVSYQDLGPDLDAKVAGLRAELERGGYVARYVGAEFPDLAERAFPPERLQSWQVVREGFRPVTVYRLRRPGEGTPAPAIDASAIATRPAAVAPETTRR